MDNRSILFVVAVSFSLFIANFFFNQKYEKELHEWETQKEQLIKKREKQQSLDISKRIAHPEELPIVEVYGDLKGKEKLHSGIKIDQNILIFPWNNQPPEKIYVSRNHDNTDFEEFSLEFHEKSSSFPLLYQKNAKSKLRTAFFEEEKKKDLQLLSTSTNSSQAEVFLGEIYNRHLTILSNSPSTNAFVLLQNEKEYLPIGIYNSSENHFTQLKDHALFTNFLTTQQPTLTPITNQESKEEFYVLENEYQQLVFSNYGGALAEINLPFPSEKNKKSLVKEIEFDRIIKESSPNNALFPFNNYYTPGEDSKGPFIRNTAQKKGGYYPILRRSFFDPLKGTVTFAKPNYYALNIVSDYPELSKLVYSVKNFTNRSITFEARQAHRYITKTFSLLENNEKAPYCIDVEIRIEKRKGETQALWLSTGVPEVEMMSGTSSPVLRYRTTRLGKSEVEKINLPSSQTTVSSMYPDWICNSNGFLGFIIDPLSTNTPGYKAQFIPGTELPSRLTAIDHVYSRFKMEDFPGYNMMLPLPQNEGNINFRFFAGPFASTILKTVDTNFTDSSTGNNPNYTSCQSFHGWFAFISEPFAKFLFTLMNFFHNATNSWALSIILLTVSLRLMLYPLNAWSMKAMRRAQLIQPQVTAIQEKYKKNPQKAQIEIMNLYRKTGANPMIGCFPLLIQMPFLIGMFDLLKSTFELRGASFIPGWIDNLTAPDVLFDWGTPIFFIGSQFHALPLLLGALMFFQQKMSSNLPKNKELWTEQDRQKATMANIMPIVFTFLFYNFPSGLNLYWLSSTLLGMGQQWLTNKQEKALPQKTLEIARKGTN